MYFLFLSLIPFQQLFCLFDCEIVRIVHVVLSIKRYLLDVFFFFFIIVMFIEQ